METLLLSKEALLLLQNCPELPSDDRARVDLALATIELNEHLAEESKQPIGRDQNGELTFLQ